MAFERSKMVLEKAGFNFAGPADAAAANTGVAEPHIVDRLIEERGEKLVKHPLWPLIRPLLYSVLNYREAIRMADDLAPLSGLAGLDYVSQRLNLDIDFDGVHHIPKEGGFILAANHPTGLADAIAIYDSIRDRRNDLSFFANRDALRVNRRFADVVIPVEWREELKSRAKSKETLVGTNRAVRENRALAIFPAGRIAYWENGKLNERPWQTSVVGLARRFELPIVPANVSARNSWLFYWFANWNTELRDMTVFHELLNKRRKPFTVRYGPIIEPDQLEGDPFEVTEAIRKHCTFDLAEDPEARFTPPG